MSLSTPTKIAVPFADSGSKNTIPDASQIGIVAGKASWPDGFPPLTMTPVAAGGVPPFGQDFNGILNKITEAIRFQQAGGAFVFDQSYATAVGGYPLGALVARSDNKGLWRSLIANNTTDPEAGGAANWTPETVSGSTAVTMTSSSVTLTALQANSPIIILSGVLTANLNLIFPAQAKTWVVVNNCTGAYSVTCKTASGTGVALSIGAVAAIAGDGTNILSPWAVSGATPVKFNNSTLIATTEFVQSALGNCSGLVSFNASATLGLTHIGKLVTFYGSTASQVLTLPAANSVPAGAGYWFVNQASVPVQISRGGADTLNINTLSGASSSNGLTILPGDSVFVSSNGAAVWNVFGWSGNNHFPKSLATNGYQTLPSGLIIQWGSGTALVAGFTPFTFPISFPSACCGVSANSTSGTDYFATASSVTASGFQCTGRDMSSSTLVACPFTYLAIGY